VTRRSLARVLLGDTRRVCRRCEELVTARHPWLGWEVAIWAFAVPALALPPQGWSLAAGALIFRGLRLLSPPRCTRCRSSRLVPVRSRAASRLLGRADG